MIKNLIIDLCGPLLVIDTGRIDRGFHALGVAVEQPYRTLYYEGRVKDYDMGLIKTETFCDNVREVLRCGLDNRQILAVWNSLIVGFDLRNVETLRRLAQRYRLFLLSNSDVENEACFRQYINGLCGFDFFAECFDEAYFSNHLHLRKPNPEIFKAIVRRHQLAAEETLVVDDCRQHCDNAKAAGLQSRQCEGPLWQMEGI